MLQGGKTPDVREIMKSKAKTKQKTDEGNLNSEDDYYDEPTHQSSISMRDRADLLQIKGRN